MVSKKELLKSVLIRRIIFNRLYGLGFVIGYKERRGELPPVDKEGLGTGPKDNGGLFIPSGLIFQDYRPDKITLQPYENLKPSKKELESIIDNALASEKATLLGEKGYAYRVLLSNVFFPRVALQIVRALGFDGKIDITLEEKLNEKHLTISYLPPSLPGEEIKYGCRSELASYLTICSKYWKHYYNLAVPELKFMNEEIFLHNLELSRKPVKEDGEILLPPYIVHCHNSRLINKSMASPISILGYGTKFGEFAMITFEKSNDVMDELKSLEKNINLISPKDKINLLDEDYFCAIRFYPKTTPGRRSPKKNLMIVSPTKDLGLDMKLVNAAVKEGYALNYG